MRKIAAFRYPQESDRGAETALLLIRDSSSIRLISVSLAKISPHEEAGDKTAT